MTDRRIVTEELPALPDDLAEAQAAKQQAEMRVSDVRAVAPEVNSLVAAVRELREHNGFGPRLTLAYQMRTAS